VCVCVCVCVCASCTKEQQIITNNQNEDTALDKVLSFLDSRNQKSGFDDLSLDESVWYLEAALNYSYCQKHNFYGNEIFDSIVFNYNLDEGGLIDDELLFETYNNMEGFVNDLIRTLKKYPYYNIIGIDIEASEEVDQFILYYGVSFTNDAAKCLPQLPFGSTDYWDYGDGGKCGEYSGCNGYGAATIFESYINGMYGNYPEGCWFTDIQSIKLTSTYPYYPLFADWDPCLSPTQMNTYFYNTHEQGFLRMPSNRNFYHIEINAYFITYPFHEARWKYGILNYPIE